jgi:hypothetical protein
MDIIATTTLLCFMNNVNTFFYSQNRILLVCAQKPEMMKLDNQLDVPYFPWLTIFRTFPISGGILIEQQQSSRRMIFYD